MAGEVSPRPSGAASSEPAVDTLAIVVSALVVAALAIFALGLDSLISALVPTMEGEVAESDE